MTDTARGTAPNTKSLAQATYFTWSSGYERVLKRFLDVSAVLLVMPVGLLLIGIMYILVRLNGGTGFYAHERVGRSGTTFKCWKIRTMVPRADERLAQLLDQSAEAREEWARDQKLQDDPRVTAVGRFLRQTSLDELPQLWNVLVGDMSLVGPRPITQDELSRYGHSQWAYLSLRPGITGLWQVSGRNDITYAERVGYDVRYRNTVSLRQDVAILCRTIRVLMARTGR